MTDDEKDVKSLRNWAACRFDDAAFLAKIEELPGRDPKLVEEVAQVLAEEGYPWTANEIRARWKGFASKRGFGRSELRYRP